MVRAGRMHGQINGNAITRKRGMSMSSKPKRKEITEPQVISTQAETGEVSVGNSARDEEIRRRRLCTRLSVAPNLSASADALVLRRAPSVVRSVERPWVYERQDPLPRGFSRITPLEL